MIGKFELPVGLILITLSLFSLAIINVLTKKVATISGIAFTIAFFIVFECSEIYNRRRHKHEGQETREISAWKRPRKLPKSPFHVRPGNVLVAVRNPNRLQHLERILLKTDTRKIDIVVLSVRTFKTGAGEYGLEPDQMFFRCRDRGLLPCGHPGGKGRQTCRAEWVVPAARSL